MAEVFLTNTSHLIVCGEANGHAPKRVATLLELTKTVTFWPRLAPNVPVEQLWKVGRLFS